MSQGSLFTNLRSKHFIGYFFLLSFRVFAGLAIGAFSGQLFVAGLGIITG